MRDTSEQARIVTRHFVGLGIGGHEGQVFVIEAGVPAPPALMVNSEPYAGPIGHEAIRHGAEAHAAYLRLNKHRPEPEPEPLWDEGDIQRELKWNNRQFTAAKSSGFPRSTHSRDEFDRDGVPVNTVRLWTREAVRAWVDRVAGLAPSGR